MASNVWIVGEINGATLRKIEVFNSAGESFAAIKSKSLADDKNYQMVQVPDELDRVLITASGGEVTIDLAAGGEGGFGVIAEG